MSNPNSQYFRDKSKENYKLKKELSLRYSTEGEPGERFSVFVKRMKSKNKENYSIL